MQDCIFSDCEGENSMKEIYRNEIHLPENGIFVGSCTYPYDPQGEVKQGGFCFTYWVPQDAPGYDIVVKRAIEENQGNLLEFSYASGDDLLKMMEEAKSAGIYAISFYGKKDTDVADRFCEFSPFYLGYDFHETFSMGLYDSEVSEIREFTAETAAHVTLREIAERFMNKVKTAAEERHAAGCGLLLASSASFYMDYEIAAGIDVPFTEDYPFGSLTVSSALNRGLYRLFDCPVWGTYLAHEWYSYLPHKNPHKMESLKTAMYLKYMSGAKIIVNESGNWTLQSSLCEDSPMLSMPRVGTKLTERVPEEIKPELLKSAEKYMPNIGYHAPTAVAYRKIISEFYDFTKANPAPAGQPEAVIGIAKGNLDISSGYPAYNQVMVSAYQVAKFNRDWVAGAPEAGFEILMNTLFPRPKMFLPNKNLHFGATPYGQADIVSFVNDGVSSEYLLKNYKVLIFSGWNTCSPKQYRVLTEYVQGGGKLCISLPHLSMDERRHHDSFELSDLVNGGDFSELCGLKVVGQGARFYWATGPEPVINELGLLRARRLGIMATPLGELEYTLSPDHYDLLAVDDEDMRPVILRCRQGKGEVYFLNTWCYPGAVNLNNGAGALDDGKGLADYLFAFAAKQGRGHVWITGEDFENPDEECSWLVFSYFPDGGKICFLNLDYDRPHKCVLHYFGEKSFVTLQPGEFRMIDAPVLNPNEKYNER